MKLRLGILFGAALVLAYVGGERHGRRAPFYQTVHAGAVVLAAPPSRPPYPGETDEPTESVCPAGPDDDVDFGCDGIVTVTRGTRIICRGRGLAPQAAPREMGGDLCASPFGLGVQHQTSAGYRSERP